MPFGVLYATKIVVALPFLLPKFLADDLSYKFTLVYSNLNASRTEYNFDGKNCIGHYMFAPGVGSIATTISFCSVGNRMSIGVFSDRAYMKDPQVLCDIFT